MSLDKLLSSLKHATREDKELVSRAYAFAQEAHKDHKRYTGEPYFTHLYATAKGLSELGASSAVVAAGLLHDSVEDVGVKSEEIAEKFGEEVRFLVDGVTKLGSYKYQGMLQHAESLRRILVTTAQDARVLLIKLMDRRHNMQTLKNFKPEKKERIAQETLAIYAPIADRLGMSELKRELEDLAFEVLQPDEYEKMLEVVTRERSEQMERLEAMRKDIQKTLGKAGLRAFSTEIRVKGLYSLYKKLERKKYDLSQIYDILAFRVMVPSIPDCYKVLGLVHSLYRPIPGKMKDYIAFQKPNGYQSLHTTVLIGDGLVVEMQIRTREMHERSTRGIASHLAYKSAKTRKGVRDNEKFWFEGLLPLITKKRSVDIFQPSWMKDLEHLQDAEPSEFESTLLEDFFTHRIFVYTPKGEVVDLPLGATPIDFAYAIHSDVGDHASGAKINGKLVQLHHKLVNGSVIEIVISKNAKPSTKWLQFVKTAAAKRKIRHALEAAKQ